MTEKKPYDFRSAFDDRGMPVNDLSKERIIEIEKAVLPELWAQMEKLRLEKPHFFKSPEKPILYSSLETKRKAES